MNGKGKAYIMFPAGNQYYALRVDQINRVVGIGRDRIKDGSFDLDGKQIQIVNLHEYGNTPSMGWDENNLKDGLNIAVCEVNQQNLGVSLGTLWNCGKMRIKSVHEPHDEESIRDEGDQVKILNLEKMTSYSMKCSI